MSTSWPLTPRTTTRGTGRTVRSAAVTALATALALGLLPPAAGVAGPVRGTTGGGSTRTWVPKVLPIIEVTGGSHGGSVHGSDGVDTFAGDSGYHAVLWRRGKLFDLGPGIAYDVDRRGTAVGAVHQDQVRHRATLWRGGESVQFAVPPGTTDSYARGINEAGTVVGTAYFVSPAGQWYSHAVVWSTRHPDRYRDLGTLDGETDRDTRLYGVGEKGVLAGYSTVQSTWEQQAFTGTARTGLRALDDGGDGVRSRAVSVAGRYIAGSIRPAGAESSHPALWKDGVPRELPRLPGDEYGELLAVNTRGTAVGYTSEGGAVWSPGKAPVLLEGLDPRGYGSPGTVTERNVVGGTSIDDDGVYMPTLWVGR